MRRSARRTAIGISFPWEIAAIGSSVGERLAAQPGHEGYGAVSVKVAYWATASVVGRVPATVFITVRLGR